MENRRKVFFNGLIYTLGRAISYTAIGVILYFGASTFSVAGFFQQWGERLLGPLLLIIGIFMLDNIRINFPGLGKLGDKMEQNPKKGFWQVLLLGIVFALAFCPYSGLLYFGMLIPITIASPSGLFLPMIFAVATGLPVIATDVGGHNEFISHRENGILIKPNNTNELIEALGKVVSTESYRSEIACNAREGAQLIGSYNDNAIKLKAAFESF